MESVFLQKIFHGLLEMRIQANLCTEMENSIDMYPILINKDENSKGEAATGVAVSERPTGPFKGAIGKALIVNEMTIEIKHLK